MTALMVGTKVLHIAAMIIWCAGLVMLPLVLSLHRPEADQDRFNRVRILTHAGYTQLVTPAAVIAIGAGIALIFLRGVFTHWFFAKLVFVSLLVALHAWTGHLVAQIGEHREKHRSPLGGLLATANVAVMTAILALVLLKPEIDETLLPQWLRMPLGYPLGFELPT